MGLRRMEEQVKWVDVKHQRETKQRENLHVINSYINKQTGAGSTLILFLI